MKILIRVICGTITIFVLCYAFGCFCNATLNIAEWYMGWRVTIAVIAFVWWFVFIDSIPEEKL